MSKPFGYSYYVDLYDCLDNHCDSLELHYRFLEEIVEVLGMTKMSAPIVMHAPSVFRDGQREEVYPDKLGVSGWVPLIESGIQVHSIEPTHFVTIDIYSCKEFKPESIRHLLESYFGPKHIEEKFFARGISYKG